MGTWEKDKSMCLYYQLSDLYDTKSAGLRRSRTRMELCECNKTKGDEKLLSTPDLTHYIILSYTNGWSAYNTHIIN